MNRRNTTHSRAIACDRRATPAFSFNRSCALGVALLLTGLTLASCNDSDSLTDAEDVGPETIEESTEDGMQEGTEAGESPTTPEEGEMADDPAMGEDGEMPGEDTVATPAIATVEELESLIGETVTVSTEVQDIVTDGVFLVYDIESMQGEQVLVVSDMDAPEVGSNVEITGDVERFDAVAVEEAYGVDFDPEIETAYEGKPYIDLMAMEQVD